MCYNLGMIRSFFDFKKDVTKGGLYGIIDTKITPHTGAVFLRDKSRTQMKHIFMDISTLPRR